jgi:hypothetical protein
MSDPPEIGTFDRSQGDRRALVIAAKNDLDRAAVPEKPCALDPVDATQ